MNIIVPVEWGGEYWEKVLTFYPDPGKPDTYVLTLEDHFILIGHRVFEVRYPELNAHQYLRMISVLKSVSPDDYHGSVMEDHSLTFKFHTKEEDAENYYRGFEREVTLWTKKTLKS